MDIMSDFIWRFVLAHAFRNVLFHYLKINIFILAVLCTRIKNFNFIIYIYIYIYIYAKRVLNLESPWGRVTICFHTR